MRQQFSMTIPMEYVISNNRMSPVWLRRKVKDGIAELTREAAQDRYPCGKASIYVGIHKRTGTLYDPVNLVDTFKPMVDTLVNMGILDEDNHRFVTGPFVYHAGTDKRLAPRTMRATVTLTDYAEVPF